MLLDRIPDQRVLRGTAPVFTWQFTDGDGEPAAPVDPVTIGIVHDDGTPVIDPGTPTDGTGDDPRTYSLSAGNNQTLDLLTATWTDDDGNEATTLVDVAGDVYFTVAEARASDPSLEDLDRYPSGDIIAVRREVEEEFEQICGYAFVPRYQAETIDGTCHLQLILARPQVRLIRSIRVYTDADSYTAWTQEELDQLVGDARGVITSRTGQSFVAGPRGLRITYEHGLGRPPADVKRAALERLRGRLNAALSGVPDRATTYTAGEGGTYALATASAFKTGIDRIDAVLDRHARRPAGIA